MKKNWKTTLAGVAIGLVTALSALNIISVEAATAIISALAALGFVVAKDSNVTGGTTQQ
jgi:hypothetical protein